MRILLLIFLFFFQSVLALAGELPAITHYKLDIRFHLKEQRIDVVAWLTVKNITKAPVAKIPFLLYRLLAVKHAGNPGGRELAFSQNIVQLADEPSLQATAVNVTLTSPLQPGDSAIVTMDYGGFIFGYPEVMAYVKDRIDEDFSLLRPDAFAYPVLAEPTFASALAASDTKFTYDIAATVPPGYRVACGGALTNSRVGPDSSAYFFHSKIPTWRIDLAVSKFAILEQSAAQLSVYFQREDSAGARNVLNAAEAVIALYTRMFGKPESFKGYTIIEIPDGWGSQASDYYFLQTAAAFKDSSRISEVYHEIGHTWNAMPAKSVKRCRYFDEAFASFFEALAVRAFAGDRAFEEHMQQSRDRFVQRAQKDKEVFGTPIAEYGTKELGRYSYSKGAWSLYVLYSLVGDKTFSSIIHTMLTEFTSHAIDFAEFQNLCERVANRNLQKYFQDWIYGSGSSQLLDDNTSIQDIVKRY